MNKAKQWETGGEEDKFLHKLVKQGKVDKFTKPPSLKKDYPLIFNDFSNQVIRNHLNLIKRRSGLYLNTESESDVENDKDDDLQEKKGEESSSSKCEINATAGSDQICHQNYPMICQTFKDPVTNYEKVLIVVSMPGGAQDVIVDLSEDGFMASIKYSWPNTMYDELDLFKRQLDATQFRSYHPMVLCFKKGLEHVRQKINVAPQSIIKVQLPLKVQTSYDSWKNWGVTRDDGTQVLLAEFTGFINEYIKKSSAVKFEN